MAEVKIQGETVSQRPEKKQLDGTEAFLLQDSEGTKHAKASTLKEFVNPGVGQSVAGMELEYEGETYEAGQGAERFNNYTANAPIGIYSHAEGAGNFAGGDYSHAEGSSNRAEEAHSHAEGNGTVAAGMASHAEGIVTHAGGMGGHAEGWGTVTQNDGEHADGKFNRSNTGETAAEQTRHSVGIGTDGDNRRNAFEIMADGSAYFYGAGGYDGTNAAEANAEGTKAETLQQTLASKVSGTGVASIQVVAELPEAQEDGVLYIVTGEGGA